MNYLILGSSAAGVNAARKLRVLDQDAQITIASKDDFLYSRCILHHYIEGKRDSSQLHFAGPNVLETHNIEFKTGFEASKLDSESKIVEFTNGEKLSYDKLLIATGSSSFVPPVPGLREGKQVVGLRDFSDAVEIKDYIRPGLKVGIIGAGLVGMDALESLTHYDLEIHLIDFAPHLLGLQLDEVSSQAYMNKAEEFGVVGHFSTLAKEVKLDTEGNVTGIELDNGESFDLDLIIASAGTRSNIGFLADSGIELWERGLVFDKFGQTSLPDVYGAGDVSGVHPIWPMAVKEGEIAARNMVGGQAEMNDFFAARATMNFFGIPTMSVGNHSGRDVEGVEFRIQQDGDVYKKIAIKDGKVIGAILQNDIDYSGILIQLIKHELDVDSFENDVFNLSYADFFHLQDDVEFSYE